MGINEVKISVGWLELWHLNRDASSYNGQ